MAALESLVFFVGPSLNMPALGRAMVAANVYQGMLLDINDYAGFLLCDVGGVMRDA